MNDFLLGSGYVAGLLLLVGVLRVLGALARYLDASAGRKEDE